MSSIPQPRFYVYVLSRPNGSPFYVGKGKGNRIAFHRWQARSGYKSPKCSVIRKIWDNGQEYHHQFVFRTDNEADAFTFECTLIAAIGRDVLCNQTDGGEGRSGNDTKPETRAKRSVAMKALYANPAARMKTSVASRLAQSTPEAKAKLSARSKARWSDPEFRAKVADSRSKAMATEEYKAKISTASKQRFSDPNERAEISKRSKARWANPETRAKLLETRARGPYKYTDEERTRRSERAKNKVMSPETRAKISAAAKARMSDPELRAKFVNSGKLARKSKRESNKV